MEQVDLDVVGKEEPPCEAIKHMAIGDVRPVEATKEEDPPHQASTPLQGPTVVLGPMNMQDLEALCLNTKALGPRGSAQDEEAPGFGTTINKRMNIFKIMSLKLMLIMTTNPYINLQIGHLIQECIKVYNRTIPLIISLGA